MSISDYAELKMLDAIFNNVSLAVATPYVSLHTADPGENGASEVSGGSYVRQLGSFGAAAAGALDNDAAVEFTLMPAETITHVAVWDAVSAGNCLWVGALTASKTLNAGDTFRFPIGDLDVTLN